MIQYGCSFIILVLMMIDLLLQLIFLFKVGIKWEGDERVSSRASFHLGDLQLFHGNSKNHTCTSGWPTTHMLPDLCWNLLRL